MPESTESTELTKAVGRLYDAFADAPRPRHIESCPCCTGDTEFRHLFQGELSDLTAEDLSRFAFKALTTVGGDDDYLYLLPRILDLTASGDLMVEGEITAGKIATTHPDSWPKARLDALDDFFQALLRGCHHDHGLTADEVICAIAICRPDIAPYLEVLQARPELLGDFHSSNAAILAKKGRLANAFWPTDSAAHDFIVAWLQEPKIEALIASYYAAEFGRD